MPDASPGQKIRLLVVDDDPEVVRLIRLILKTEGFTAIEALNGTEGISLAEKELPDLILLDIMMPDIGGYEVYRRIRDNPETSHIPIIFVSAKAKWESVEKGISLGAEGYITKPFPPALLISEVKRVLGSRP